jgi:hypothetical protein
MVVPAGPSRDRHEAATWPLRWPWYFFMGPRQTRVEEEVSKARREDRAEQIVCTEFRDGATVSNRKPVARNR